MAKASELYLLDYRPLNYINDNLNAVSIIFCLEINIADLSSEFKQIVTLMLRFGFPLSIATILSGVQAQFYNILIYIYSSDVLIGNYQFATKFTVLITFIATPISTVLFPAFSKMSILRWRTEIHNNTGASPGTYTGFIAAKSANSGETALYDIVEIIVKKTPQVGGNAIAWGGTELDIGVSLVLDNDGNMYVAGMFEGTCDFEPSIWEENRTSNGLTDVFLVKYDQDWNLIWVQTFGGEDEESVYEIVMDSSGNIYITGDFVGTVDFDPGSGTDIHSTGSIYSQNIYLSSFTPGGEFRWANTWGGFGYYQTGYDISIDNSDNVYVIGMYIGNCDFDPGPGEDIQPSHSDYYDAFLSKFATNGDYIKAVTWGGPGVEYGLSVINDIPGNTYVSGIFSDTCDFDPGPGFATKSPVGYYDAYVCKYDWTGDFNWVGAYGGTSLEFPEDIITDSSSNLFITGYFYYTTDLDPGVTQDLHTSNGGPDIFLSKLDSNGLYEWGYTWGSTEPEDDDGLVLVLDEAENILITGIFKGNVDFDPTYEEDFHYADRFSDFYLCSYTNDGIYQWSKAWRGIYADLASDIKLHDGSYYMTGYFGQTIDFDPDTGLDEFTAAGYLDAFLLRYTR